MRVPNVSTRDFAFAYNWENIVCFDYDRDTKEHINYGLLENLKNGALWSPKYVKISEKSTSKLFVLPTMLQTIPN